MKWLKSHRWIFLILILAGSCLIDGGSQLFSPQAEIEECCNDLKELEIGHSNSSADRHLKSGDGGNDLPPSLVNSSEQTALSFNREAQLLRVQALPHTTDRSPYYILYCNPKLPSC
ncbi:MAG: hypothetical protein QM496_21925 [Verrucomicrobiota bacterium]